MATPKPIWTFEVTSQKSVEDLQAVLMDIREGDFLKTQLPVILQNKGYAIVVKTGHEYTITFQDGHKEFVEIDRLNHQLSIKEEWWYKGLYSLIQEPTMTRVKYEVHNIAPKFRWAASLMILKDKNTFKIDFETFVKNLEKAIDMRHDK